MTIELRQRSPLGALFRSPLGVLGPGEPAATPTVPDVLIRAAFDPLDRFIQWDPMSTVIGPNWLSRAGQRGWGLFGSRLTLTIDSQVGEDLHWSDFIGLTVKSQASGAELTIDGTVYGSRPSGPVLGENVHLFPCSIGGDASIEILQRSPFSAQGWDVIVSYPIAGPDVLPNEDWPFVEEWALYDRGFRGTAFFFDGWGPSVDVPELPECGGGVRGPGDSKMRPYLDGVDDAMHEPAQGPDAYWFQWGLGPFAFQFDGPLTMENGCFRQYREVLSGTFQFIASNPDRTISQGLESRAVPYVDDGISSDPAFFIHHPTPDARQAPLIGQLPWYSVAVGAQVTIPWDVVRDDAATVVLITASGNFAPGTVAVDYEARELTIQCPAGVADLFQIEAFPRDNWNTSGGTPATVSLWAQ